MAYSPPETLFALHAGAHTITSDTASDLWAIGVITYELVLGRPAFPAREWSRNELTRAALGELAYPWEERGCPGQFRHIPEARALSSALRACLNRDPSRRPTAAALQLRLNQLFDESATTSETAPPKGKAGPSPPCCSRADRGPESGITYAAAGWRRGGWFATSTIGDCSTTHSVSSITPLGSHTGRTRHIFHASPDEASQGSRSTIPYTLTAEMMRSASSDMPKLADVYRSITGASTTDTPTPRAPAAFVSTCSVGSESPNRVQMMTYCDIPPALLPLSLETRGESEVPAAELPVDNLPQRAPSPAFDGGSADDAPSPSASEGSDRFGTPRTV